MKRKQTTKKKTEEVNKTKKKTEEVNKRLVPLTSKESRRENNKIISVEIDKTLVLVEPPPHIITFEPEKKKRKKNDVIKIQTSWVREFCSPNIDKNGSKVPGEYLCGFETCSHRIFKMTTNSPAHGQEHYLNRHPKNFELISQALSKGKDMKIFAKQLLEKENKLEARTQKKLTEFKRISVSSPDKTLRELHWLLCGIKNCWSFNSQSAAIIIEHFSQFFGIKYPTRKDLSGTLLEGLYKVTQEAVSLEVKNSLFFHLTGDGWTSINQEYFLAITAHYYKDKMKRITLGVKQLYGKKTAVLLMKSVTETYNKILPEESLITSFIVDGGANYNKASEIIIDEENVNCFAHTLQIPINKIISPSKNKNKYQICITEVRKFNEKSKIHSYSSRRF